MEATASAPPDPLARLAALRRPQLLILVVSLLLFLPGLLAIPPSDRDESRFAQATKQMLETGDFVEIRFGDVARNKKPVGIHWAQAAAVAAAEGLGLARRTDIWPYRLPSVAGGVLAALFTFALGRHLVGREAALVAALLLPASLVVAVEARIAKTDAALLAAVTAMMGLFARAVVDPLRFSAGQAAGFWLALGIGALLKGPVAPMVAGLAGLALWWLDRRAGRPRDWLAALRPGWGVAVALAVVAPWGVLVWLATDGAFFRDALAGDLGGKVVGAAESHGGPPGYHLAAAALTLFPVSLVVLPAMAAAWAARRDPAVRALLAWILPSWVVFELLPTKLPHYVSVTFPALALLAGRWLADPARPAPPRWLARLALGLWLAAAAILAALAVAAPVAVGAPVPWGTPAAVAVLAALVAAVLRAPEPRRAAVAMLVAAPLLYAAVFEGLLPRLEPLWISPRVVAAIEAHWRAEGRPAVARPFGTAGFHEPSLVFLAGTDTRLLRSGAEAARHLAERPGGLALVRDRNEAEFRAEAARLGLAPRPVASIAGLNYSRGQRLVLTLYAR